MRTKETMTKKEIAFKERMAKQKVKKGFCDEDVWSIDIWFCKTISPMLRQLAKTSHGCPLLDENGDVIYKEKTSSEELDIYAKRWEETLLHMAFLADEMHEDTCSMKNPFEKERKRIYKTFEKKYGFWGEKLYTEEDKKKKEEGIYNMYTPEDDPIHGEEYQKIINQHSEYEGKIADYMERCKEEFFLLFCKYFRHLWD
jgi:hypothetical protein